MDKKQFIFLVLSVVFTFCGTLKSASPGNLPKLAPPPIVSQWKKEEIRVSETGEFSSIDLPEKDPSGKKKGNTASLVSARSKKFFWRPSPQLSSAIRTADLTGAAISADGSLVVVTERIGGEGKPNSTRFLFFDVPNRRLAGGFTLPRTLISSIAFSPHSNSEIVGIRHADTHFKEKNGIVRIDLVSKRIVDSLEASSGKVSSFVTDGKGKIFFSAENSSLIFEAEVETLSANPSAVKSRITSPELCIAGELLIASGKEGIEVFRKDHGRWIADEKLFTFPEPFHPFSCSVVDTSAPAICFAGTNEGDLWYFRKGSFRKLKEKISGIHLWDAAQKIFFAEISANSRIALFQMPDGAENAKPVTPNRLKPANRNSSWALLRAPAMKDQMVQIDNRGNVFLLDYSKVSRWKKYVIYIADRAGFR